VDHIAVRRSQRELERSEQHLTVELAESNSALAAKIQELARSEQRFQGRVAATSQILWKTGPEGHMTGEQSEWAAFTGQTIVEYHGLGWSTAVHPGDAQVTRDGWNRAVAERRPLLFEHRVRRQDGVYRLFSISAAPVLNNDTSIREWVGVHNDITEQRKREEEVLAQEANYRFLSESMPQIVWTAGPDGGREYFNRRWSDYTGMPPGQAQGWGWVTSVHPDDVKRCLNRWNLSVATGELYECEYRLRRASDGIYRWQLCRACPRMDKAGAIVKWFGTCTDIEDYKNAEAENRRLRDELEYRVYQRTSELEAANVKLKSFSRVLELSNGVLQDFASVAAHDLQEPLRKIQAFGDRLKVGYQKALGNQGQDYLNRMLNAASRMQALIHDLLSFSRLASEGRPFVPVDLASVTREVLSDLEERISETGARIEIGELPVIQADPVQIRQLLQNLVGNSLKFHKKDATPIVTVYATTVCGSNGDPSHTLFVEDNGIGFDERYLDRIFTVFQRLHGRTEYEGTGVGLAICRKIAQLHGGDITARSTLNLGSTFIVTMAPALSQCASCIRPEATQSDRGSAEPQTDLLAACGKECV
jgi:PAS domain S-box-containing protein